VTLNFEVLGKRKERTSKEHMERKSLGELEKTDLNKQDAFNHTIWRRGV